MTYVQNTRLESIKVSDDGRSLTLSFADGDTQVFEIEIPTPDMRPTVHAIVQALLEAEAKNEINKRVMFPMIPSKVDAELVMDNQELIMIFRMPSGFDYSFAIPSSEALRVGQTIVAAAQKSLSLSPPTAH